MGGRRADIRLQLKSSTPPEVLRPYRTGSVTVRLTNVSPGPTDTLRLQRATVITQRPMKIRPRLLARACRSNPGSPSRSMRRTAPSRS